MVILITGDTGLLGKNLLQALKKTKHKVYGISRKKDFDLREGALVHDYIQRIKPDVIYHLAANVDKPRGEVSPMDMTERNIGIFVNVLTAAINAKVKKFIFSSSIAVYGDVDVPYMESGLTEPLDVYGINKLACEQILKIMAKVYGFEFVILRLHNLYGPHQNMNDPYKNVIALLMRKLIEDQPYKLYGKGEMRRAFSYIGDVVEVFIGALKKKFSNKTVNIGSEKDISMKELSDLLQNLTGLKAKVELAESRKQELAMFIADHTLQSSLVRYKETPLKEGLLKTWDWIKKNGLGNIEEQRAEINV
jgi:UDP-glucose 4-epimerase